jgi:hypothetical protein
MGALGARGGERRACRRGTTNVLFFHVPPSIAERRPNPGLGAFLMASAIGFLGLKKRFAYPDSA